MERGGGAAAPSGRDACEIKLYNVTCTVDLGACVRACVRACALVPKYVCARVAWVGAWVCVFMCEHARARMWCDCACGVCDRSLFLPVSHIH